MITRTGRIALAAAASLILLAGGAPAAEAATATGAQGGYRVTPATIQSARVALHAPKINCAKATKQGQLRLGLFGGTSGHAWSVAVIASCHGGEARYRAEFSQDVGQTALTVHRGDLIRLTIKPGPEYEIENVTTGEGEGGSSSSGPGDSGGALRHVVIGGHVRGTFPAGTHVTLRAAKVNRKPVADVAHQRQAQQHDSAKLLVAGALNQAGSAFTLTTR